MTPEDEKGKRRAKGDKAEGADTLTLVKSPTTRNWSVPSGTLVKRPRPGIREPGNLANPDLSNCSCTDTLGGGGFLLSHWWHLARGVTMREVPQRLASPSKETP